MRPICTAFLDTVTLDNDGEFSWHEIWAELEEMNHA